MDIIHLTDAIVNGRATHAQVARLKLEAAATSPPASAPAEPAGPTYSEWSESVRRLIDLETLARILGRVVHNDGLQIPCTCTLGQPGRCDRCQVARIVAENMPRDTWNVYECEQETRTGMSLGMTLVARVCAQSGEQAMGIVRQQLERRRRVGRLIARLKADEDRADREQAERDAEGW